MLGQGALCKKVSWNSAKAFSDRESACRSSGSSPETPACIRVKLFGGSPKSSDVNVVKSPLALCTFGIDTLVAIARNLFESGRIPSLSFSRRTRCATSVPLAPVYVWASSSARVTPRSSPPLSQARVMSKIGLSIGRMSMYSSIE